MTNVHLILIFISLFGRTHRVRSVWMFPSIRNFYSLCFTRNHLINLNSSSRIVKYNSTITRNSLNSLVAVKMEIEGENAFRPDQFWKEMSFTEKVRYVWSHITLEPMVACFVMPSMLLMLGVQNLNLEKACRVNLGYNQTICDALRNRDTSQYEA